MGNSIATYAEILRGISEDVLSAFMQRGRVCLNYNLNELDDSRSLFVLGEVQHDGFDYGVGEVYAKNGTPMASCVYRKMGEQLVFVQDRKEADEVFAAFADHGKNLFTENLLELEVEGEDRLGFKTATCLLGESPVVDVVAILSEDRKSMDDVVLRVHADLGPDSLSSAEPRLSMVRDPVVNRHLREICGHVLRFYHIESA